MTSTTTGHDIDEGFSGKRTAEIVGITYRQLDYWARTDLVRPSLTDAAGSGSRRRYSYRDLLELKIIKKLLDAGIRLETVREVFAYLQENLGEEIASANLVISDHQVVLVRSSEEIIDLVAKGQGVLNLLALGGVKAEIDAIVDLRPTNADDGAGSDATPTAEAAARASRVTTGPSPLVAFAHNSERQFAALLDFYGVAWEYEPHTFVLREDDEGLPLDAFSPDFYLPAYDLHIEITTQRQKLVTRKNGKARRLRERYPEVSINVLYQRDYLHLLAKYGLEAPSQHAGASTRDGATSGDAAPTLLGLGTLDPHASSV